MATKLDKIEKSFLKRKYILLKTQALYYSFKIVLETKFSWIDHVIKWYRTKYIHIQVYKSNGKSE